MRSRLRIVLVSALFPFLLMSNLLGAGAAASGTGSYPCPARGDWVVREDTEVRGESFVVSGSIVIESGARLRLIDSTVYINCSYPGEHRVLVRAGGSLEVSGGSLLPLNSSSPYRLIVESRPQGWLSPELLLVLGLLLGLGVGFPSGVAAAAYAYKRFFSRNLPPPV